MTQSVRYALAIDLGGTKVAAAVVREDGTIVAQAHCSTDAVKGGDWVLNRVKEAALEALERSKMTPTHLLGVGMGTPGVVDTEHGVMLSEAVNIPDWKGRELKRELERVIGLPAFVENDANAAGLGEFVFGAGKGHTYLIFVTLGTGIGFFRCRRVGAHPCCARWTSLRMRWLRLRGTVRIGTSYRAAGTRVCAARRPNKTGNNGASR